MTNNLSKPIAMWSGPRNISTAMMRSFENREDCRVIDEPLYGYYLKATGIEHPGAQDIIATMDTDWRSVTQELIKPLEANQLFYQKHMTQHILPEVDLSFTDQLTNCFLIRDPKKIIRSYAKVRANFVIEELGFPQQLAIFKRVTETLGQQPIVIDSDKLLENPKAMLEKLCARLGIPFTDKMLNWPKGKRDSDGCWAPYWYERVEQSTGFEQPQATKLEQQSDVQDKQTATILKEAQTIYEQLKAYELNLIY